MDMDKQALVLHLLDVEDELTEALKEIKHRTLKFEAQNILMNTVRELLAINTKVQS